MKKNQVEGFELAQNLKGGDLVRDGIDYGRIVATSLYIKGRGRQFLTALYYMIYDACIEVELNDDLGKNDLPFFYKESEFKKKYYSEIGRNFTNVSSAVANVIELPVIRNLSVFGFVLKIKQFIIFYLMIRSKKIKFEQKILISSICAYAHRLAGEIDPILVSSHPFCVATFCDVHLEDNLVAQLAKKYEITTVTLQHGLYRFIDRGEMSADREAYQNFISDKLFCWGEATVKEFAKANISSDRFLITGAFRKFDFKNSTEVFDFTCAGDPPLFGVVFNGDSSKKSNFELLKIAEEIATRDSMRYVVRAHPLNKVEEYREYVSENCAGFFKIPVGSNDYMENCLFSLIHMSGVLIEFLACKHKFFIFDDGRLEDMYKLDGVVVENYDEFSQKRDLILSNHCSEMMDNFRLYFNDDTHQTVVVRDFLLSLQ